MVVAPRREYIVISQVTASLSVFGTAFVLVNAIVFRKHMWTSPQRRMLMMSVIVDLLQSLNVLIGDAVFPCAMQGALSSFLQVASLLWITSATLILYVAVRAIHVVNLKRWELACHPFIWTLSLVLMIINLSKKTYGVDAGLMASTVCWITSTKLWYRFGTLYIILFATEVIHLVLAVKCLMRIHFVHSTPTASARVAKRQIKLTRIAWQILSFDVIYVVCWVISISHCIIEMGGGDHSNFTMHIIICLLCPTRGFFNSIVITVREKFWRRWWFVRRSSLDSDLSTSGSGLSKSSTSLRTITIATDSNVKE